MNSVLWEHSEDFRRELLPLLETAAAMNLKQEVTLQVRRALPST